MRPSSAPNQQPLFASPAPMSAVMAGSETIVVATDGSCLTNPGPGGWCWYHDDRHWRAGGEADTTNNRMELLAVAEALGALPASSAILIRADSSYTIDACTKWIHGWKRRGWRTAQGTPVKNREIIETIGVELAARAARGAATAFEWVKGHAGHVMNEAADARCRAAAEASKRGERIDAGPGWSPLDGAKASR